MRSRQFLNPRSFLLFVCVLVFIALQPASALPSRVQQPLKVNEVPELRGYLGERWEANRTGSLHGFDIGRYVRLVEVRNHRAWWWAGEQDGKWLESAVLSSANSDKELREKAGGILGRIIASQEPDGYVGITPKDIRTPEQPLRGMDPYELYFKLHALVTAYEQWGDKTALASASKLGDYFVNNIGPGKAEFWPSALRPPENRGKVLQGQSKIAGHSVHYSWEGTLLIDPMLRLALATGDARYSNWSKWVAGNIDKWSGWDSFSKLDKVASGEMGIHEIQPYVHAHTFQMNFLGFLRLYEITGDLSYLRKVAGAWADIASRQMYITGGVSVGEHYEAGHIKPVTGHVVETCATMSWLQVTESLLELTGEIKYADAIEKLLWNHVFASQAIDGDSYRYHTPPNGEKPQGYFHGPDCCTSSGHRMVSLLPTFLYGKDDNGVFVNQYGASTAEVKLSNNRVLRLRQDTDYPEGETATLKVEAAPASVLAIRFRLPSWCANPEIRLNGMVQEKVTPGTYFAISRRWIPGDKVTVTLPMKLRWVQSDAPWRTVTTSLSGGETMHKPVEGDTAPWALTRGPVVYVVDTFWWSDTKVPAPTMIGDNLAVIPDLSLLEKMEKPPGIVGPAYEATFATTSGETVRATMVPFTNIGRWYRDGAPRPDRNAAAYSYAVWLQARDTPAFQERIRLAAEHRNQLANAIDLVEIGDPASETAHRVSGGSAGRFNDRNFRHGREFSYELKMLPERPAKLVVTYWGGDVRRIFDVIANDQTLRTQDLDNSKPGEFFEETYDLPLDLIQGKTDDFGRQLDHVTIRFKSISPGEPAGGIFGLRTE